MQELISQLKYKQIDGGMICNCLKNNILQKIEVVLNINQV